MVNIRAMWPSGHGGAWLCTLGGAIVRGKMVLTGCEAPPKRPKDTLNRASSPVTALIFGGFAHVRRRQGRLRPVFRHFARHSRGVLRRHVEIWRCGQQGAGAS